MSEIKTYMVICRIDKPNLKTVFRKEIRALRPEHAIEEIYKIIGSKHRAKRFQIKIMKVEEIAGEK
ncbi:MAG: 50S ribosomal protein L18Ae [Candidatus Bathyarchaeia archaeon]